MALPGSVTREQAPSTPEPHPFPFHTTQPAALALLNGALYLLRSLREMSSAGIFKSWKQIFLGEGGTRAVFNMYF